MNIHGYKQKKKNITQSLDYETSKKPTEQCQPKIKRLEKAKALCASTVRNLIEGRNTNKKSKREFKKVKKRQF